MSDPDTSTVTQADASSVPLGITLTYDPSINYAFQQNAIPVIRDLSVVNRGAQSYKNLLVTLRTEPLFAVPVEIRISELAPGGEFRTGLVDLKLSPAFLSELRERVNGLLKIEIRNDEAIVSSKSLPITLLASNEWAGLVSLPEILAAFVLPNDPAVLAIIDQAAEILKEKTGKSALSGYQEKSRRYALEQVAAIYQAVGKQQIRYISPPASFEQSGQKVRFPTEICEQRFGTCLDLALLFAACFEYIGLHPLVLLHQGHAYAGCWLEDRTLPESTTDDLQTIRKLNQLNEITVFETTIVTQDQPNTLKEAEALAQPHLSPEIAFRLALDIKRARAARILPLPFAGEIVGKATPASPSKGIQPNNLGVRDVTDALDPKLITKPQKPATRIDQWKGRLLDLSLRNRLLNFRATASTVQILCPEPEGLEDRLAANAEFKLLARPSVMDSKDPRSATLFLQTQNENPVTEFLHQELEQQRLHSSLDASELQGRLTELLRSSKLSIEEGGSNTLFLALGFLEWRESDLSERKILAPLLLIPVELKRKSIGEQFTLKRLDEETRLNVTLMEMLRQNFAKEIDGLDPLPEDDSGVDVALIFRLFQEAVRDLQGWEVKREIWLGQFSFSKFLLWKDLTDRLDALTRNRVVDHLVNRAGQSYQDSGVDVQPNDLDDQFQPSDLFCPRSADSSQLTAVLAAAAGRDFVLEGPPGTGKSQTITNIIAHCLAIGKRVLFVAEKRAALDVVYRRLKEDGLEPFCLELHSNKAGKGEVLAQLKTSLDFTAQHNPAEWSRRAIELQKLRDELNAYVRSLHKLFPCGLSAYTCLAYLLPRKSKLIVTLNFPDLFEHSAEKLEQFRLLAVQLGERANLLGGTLLDHPLGPLHATEWSPTWEDNLFGKLLTLTEKSKTAASETENMRNFYLRKDGTIPKCALDSMFQVTAHLLEPLPVGGDFFLTPWDQISKDIEHWLPLTLERTSIRNQLKEYDEKRLLELDMEGLSALWQDTQQKWFLPKLMGSIKVQNALRTARIDRQKPPSDQVLSTLQLAGRLRGINAVMSAANPVGNSRLGALWNNGEPDSTQLERAKNWGESLFLDILALAGEDIVYLGKLREMLAGLFHEGVTSFASASPIGQRLMQFQGALSSYSDALDDFAKITLLDQTDIDSSKDYFNAVTRLCERVASAKPAIRYWCAWQRSRNEAEKCGMMPIVHAIEQGNSPAHEAPELFERSYRRALWQTVLSTDQVLREFFGNEHSTRIRRFRDIDEQLTKLTRETIRARLASNLPIDRQGNAPAQSELGLILRSVNNPRGRRIPSIRDLIKSTPAIFPRLKPCVLMSPLSVAQYLDAGHEAFDVVVFDEASQIPVWDAVGAIARGKQLIIVGDPKQLPPTNFFGRVEEGSDEESITNFEDMESILDELISNRMLHKRLLWHYRSRHESLITFSNRSYYDNSLLTFPSPDLQRGGVKFHFVEGANYDLGNSRTNKGEAEALVRELVRRLRDPANRSRSFGVVTFSQAQQKLVENLLDEQRHQFPEIEIHFSDSPPVEGEPVFVKNLENVQGDERDVIIFSICYGPDEQGRVSMNFGPLNRDSGGAIAEGQRRLNVAITRAKEEILVFTTLRGDKIDLTRTRARGVRDLKRFLEYAERGITALMSASSPGASDLHDSEFERLVAEQIRLAGYEVHCQVGCSGYRIDLAVVDPNAPGRYLLGIECDGATYHRAATARDRDKLRQRILEGLNWRLHRIWSTDWWHEPEKQMQLLLAAIEDAKLKPIPIELPTVQPLPPVQTVASFQQIKSAPLTGVVVDSMNIMAAASTDDTSYIVCKLQNYVSQDRFFDYINDKAIMEQMKTIIQTEGPISRTLLFERMRTLHGFGRLGRQIRERLNDILRNLRPVTTGKNGEFCWPEGVSPSNYAGFRLPTSDPLSERSPEDITPEEQANLMLFLLKRFGSLPREDLLKQTAVSLGSQRPSSTTIASLEGGLNLLVGRKEITEANNRIQIGQP